jgi:hypothetical protein
MKEVKPRVLNVEDSNEIDDDESDAISPPELHSGILRNYAFNCEPFTVDS